MKEITNPTKKYGSASLVVSHNLKSSPKRANMVVAVISTVTECPSTICLNYYLRGTVSSSPACPFLLRESSLIFIFKLNSNK